MHANFVGKELRRGEGHTGGNEPLHGRIVREVQEEDRALQSARALEVVHEDAGLLVGDAHRGKDDTERLLAPEDLRLPRYLQGEFIVGQTGS